VAAYSGILVALAALGGCDVKRREVSGACDGAVETAPGARGLLVVSGVPQESTNVSVVSWNRDLLTPSLLSSGSTPVRLTTTLSGDVVSPTHASMFTGKSVIIDRTNGVITWMNPSNCTVDAQLQVGGNPQDLLELDPHRALVTRLARPGDIVVVDPSKGALVRHLTLPAPPAPAAGNYPYQILPWAGLALVTLQRFNASFHDAATAAIAAIDPTTLETRWTLELTGMKNCGPMVELDDHRVVVACTGVIAATLEEQTAHAGLVMLQGDERGLAIEKSLPATALGGVPSFETLAVLDGTRVVFLALGNSQSEPMIPDRWITTDMTSGEVATVHTSRLPFRLGSFFCRTQDVVRCAGTDAETAGGELRWYHLEGHDLVEDPPLRVDPYGQPPWSLGPL
jgi:hypothetical protein